MKKLLLAGVAFFILSTVVGQVEKLPVNDKTYYGTKNIPKEIMDDIRGLYQYEKTKAPIVEIDNNGVNSFQPHDVPKYPVEYWIETDEKGNIQKETSKTNKNYRVVLILKYGDNGQTGWKGAKKDQWDRIDVAVAFDQGYAIVLGERFMKLK